MVSSARKTPLAFDRLRADADRVFTGLGVRQSQQFTRASCKRGHIVSEPVAIAARSPEVLVEWHLERGVAKAVPVALFRLELSGPDRLRAAAPDLTPRQLEFIAQTADWTLQNWEYIDKAADQWQRAGSLVHSAVESMDVYALREVGGITDFQRKMIAEVVRSTEKTLPSAELPARWKNLRG